MPDRARKYNKTPTINVTFKNTYFPLTIIEWNRLDWKFKNSDKIEDFKRRILSIIRPFRNIYKYIYI